MTAASAVTAAIELFKRRLDRIERDIARADDVTDMLPTFANVDRAVTALAVSVALERRHIIRRSRTTALAKPISPTGDA